MTGQDQVKLIKDAEHITKLFTDAGFRVFHPVLEEGLKHKHEKLTASAATLPPKWRLDKEAIRHSFCLVDASADLKSEGREHEVGLMRYCYWRPVIRISPRHAQGFYSIACLEDDIIVGSSEEAVLTIKKLFGTRSKRVWWRLKMLNRTLIRFFIEQVRGFIL
jgi:hypothetical protein